MILGMAADLMTAQLLTVIPIGWSFSRFSTGIYKCEVIDKQVLYYINDKVIISLKRILFGFHSFTCCSPTF